jgi:hypothetical protein
MPNAADRYQQLQLITLGEQLTEALRAKDWERVGQVDLQVRRCLVELATVESPSPELQKLKTQLHELYARVLPAYANACEQLRQLLINHMDYAEGRSAYLRTDLLQGER